MNPEKIHVGAGNVILNPESSPITFDSSSDGGLFTYNGELEPIMIDQVLAPVGYFVPGEECQFETMIAESSATYMQYALGATDQTISTQVADASNKGYSQIAFGGNYILTDYVFEYKAKKRNASNLYIIIRLHKVNISVNLEDSYKKDGVTYHKLIVKAMADTTKDPGEQLGYYREETADVTGTTATLAVSTTDPADDATGVALDDVIDITFNRDVHPDSVVGGNFVLVDTSDYSLVTATVAYTGTGATKVTVTPSANLTTSRTYLLIISENVRALDDYSKMADDVPINFTTT